MIVPKESYVRSKWMNGLGETLQLTISPQNADFKLQEFQYRISVASLTTELSPFSQFSSYHRGLLILHGGPVVIDNKTKGQSYTVNALKDVINFDGADWLQSQAVSAGSDFNFFLRKARKGGLDLHHFEKSMVLNLGEVDLIYNPSSNAFTISKNQEQWTINPGQLFEIKNGGKVVIQVHAQGTFIHCFILPDI